METFSALLALCAGEYAELSCFFFICILNKRLGNNLGAGDLRRHCAHYDVIVMAPLLFSHVIASIKHRKTTNLPPTLYGFVSLDFKQLY